MKLLACSPQGITYVSKRGRKLTRISKMGPRVKFYLSHSRRVPPYLESLRQSNKLSGNSSLPYNTTPLLGTAQIVLSPAKTSRWYLRGGAIWGSRCSLFCLSVFGGVHWCGCRHVPGRLTWEGCQGSRKTWRTAGHWEWRETCCHNLQGFNWN